MFFLPDMGVKILALSCGDNIPCEDNTSRKVTGLCGSLPGLETVVIRDTEVIWSRVKITVTVVRAELRT